LSEQPSGITKGLNAPFFITHNQVVTIPCGNSAIIRGIVVANLIGYS